jgi:hypothetical protein
MHELFFLQRRRKMKITRIRVFILLLFMLVPIACAGSSPSDAVKKCAMLANEGKYSEASKYLSKDAINFLQSPSVVAMGGMKGFMDRNTKNGTITKIEVIKEEVRGEAATDYTNTYYKDGEVERNEETHLIKEDGKWKIAAS